MSAICALHGRAHRLERDLGIAQTEKRFEVAPVDGVNPPAGDLEVLVGDPAKISRNGRSAQQAQDRALDPLTVDELAGVGVGDHPLE